MSDPQDTNRSGAAEAGVIRRHLRSQLCAVSSVPIEADHMLDRPCTIVRVEVKFRATHATRETLQVRITN